MATKAKYLALSVGNNIDASGNVDGDTLDNLDSTQFLRSDTSDTMTGKLSVSQLVVTTNNLETHTDIELGGRAIIKTSGNEMWFANADVNTGGFYWATGGTGQGGTASTNRSMALTYDGKLGIGTTSPTYKLQVEGNTRINGTSDALTVNTTRAGTLMSLRLNGSQAGTIDVSTSGTTYNTTSDRRLKENIELIADGKEKLLAMNPVTHTWKADPNGDAVHGFIAQEMQEVVPEAVSGGPDGDDMMSMDYGRITPVIVAALQDALKEIEELKTRINELEAK